MIQHRFDTTAEADTEAVAEKIGARLKGGEVIELMSDVGGGKTTFARGLARGAGSDDPVASPTFTVSRIYETAAFPIHHFDLYRVQEAGILEHELAEATEDEAAVVVVEWGETVKHVLPDNRLRITLNKTGDHSRTLLLESPDTLTYVLEEL